MKPTTITLGTPSALSAFTAGSGTDGQLTVAVADKKHFGSVVLTNTQHVEVASRLSQLEFDTIPSRDIVSLGFAEYQGLQQTLDGFLSGLSMHNAEQVFQIFQQLSDGVDAAKLKDIAENIGKIDKPAWYVSLFRILKSKKKIEASAQSAYQTIVDRLQGKTKTLCDVIRGLENELGGKITTLFTELQRLEQVKESYGTHRKKFTVAVAVAEAFLEQSKQHVAKIKGELKGSTDPNDTIRMSELDTKLQLLESRTIALLGSFTSLPADQLIIQQIEHAGIATIQETMTTASGRFASIKMTLLKLHGAIEVKGLQRINAAHAQLDQHLHEVSALITQDVVTAAALAPGENRLAQAKQILEIVTETRTLLDIADKARQVNSQKFDEARQIISTAREGLTELQG
jgi:hypothetical protein